MMTIEEKRDFINALIGNKFTFCRCSEPYMHDKINEYILGDITRINLQSNYFPIITFSGKQANVRFNEGFNQDSSYSWRIIGPIGENKQPRVTPKSKEKEEKHKCTCNIRDIMTYGCKCGGI
jgi:hypothetical protein